MANWIKIIEIRIGSTNEVDFNTGKRLNNEYLFFKEFCVLHRDPIPNIEHYNRESTPKELQKYWERHDALKASKISKIRDIMQKFNIKKSDL